MNIKQYLRILSFTVCLLIFYFCYFLFLSSHTLKFYSLTALSNSALTSRMKSYSSSLTIICSCWNKRNIKKKELTGLSSILAWTY